MFYATSFGGGSAGGGMWTPLQQATWAASSAAKDLDAVTSDYDVYAIVLSMQPGSTAEGELQLTINGDTADNYYDADVHSVYNSVAGYIKMAGYNGDITYNSGVLVQGIIQRLANSVGLAYAQYHVAAIGGWASTRFHWQGGADLTKVTITPTQAVTAQAILYGLVAP